MAGNGKSFLFSITDNIKYYCIDKFTEITSNNNYGPCFGGG